MQYTSLKKCECVSNDTGERLGYLTDLVIDDLKGIVTHLVISDKRKLPMRKDSLEHIIRLDDIVTVGEDVLIIASKNNK